MQAILDSPSAPLYEGSLVKPFLFEKEDSEKKEAMELNYGKSPEFGITVVNSFMESTQKNEDQF